MDWRTGALIAVVATLVVNHMACAAQVTDLWRGIPAGMTPAQVRSQFPDAQPADAPDREGGSVLTTHRPIVGHRAEIEFHFAAGRLHVVIIQLSSQSAPLTPGDADELKSIFVQSWGSEVHCDPPIDDSDYCQGLKDGVAISLQEIRSGGASPGASVVIGYFRPEQPTN
jgi:hypothetical protein